jgi:hypothetical protein
MGQIDTSFGMPGDVRQYFARIIFLSWFSFTFILGTVSKHRDVA